MIYAIGIDIGGMTTRLGAVDSEGEIHHLSIIKTHREQSFEYFLPRLCEKIDEMINAYDKSIGLGIGAPNGNFLSGTIEHPANLNWEGITPIVQILNKKYNINVVLTNDANAAAMGELIFGAGRGMKNFIMITLGTGLGCGIIADGKLFYGATGFAGELGHITIEENGRPSPFARRGSLESYCSATGLVKTAIEMMEKTENNSLLKNIPAEKIDAKLIFEAAKNGDLLARNAFDYTGRILGKSFANIAMILSPEAFIIGGGLANGAEFFLDITRTTMEENLIPVFKGSVRVLLSELQERNAAVLGAAALVLK